MPPWSRPGVSWSRVGVGWGRGGPQFSRNFPAFFSCLPATGMDNMTDDKMSEGSDDHSDHQGSHKKRRRGLAKGAEGAKYCRMAAETRLAQYPDAPLAVRH